jgi:hypothetical protein
VGSNWRRKNGTQDDELDSAACDGEPSTKWRSLKHTGHAVVVAKAMSGRMVWLEVERSEGKAT